MPAHSLVELLWGTGQPPRRGPKPSLSAEVIVEAAVAIADAEGLAAVSMQRLAERLGRTKMSLYRYLPGKTELHALMLEAALGEPPAELPAPWRVGLASWATAVFDRYRAHPWALELTPGVRPLGPHELGWLELALTALADTGLSGAQQLDTIVVLNGHVRGLVNEMAPDGGEHLEKRLAEQMGAVFALAGDRYPRAVAALSEPATGERDDALRFGIDRILDGVEAFLAAGAG